MKITSEEVRRIAQLAHLEIDGVALETMAADLSEILSYVEQLSEAGVEGIEFEAPGAMALREDEPHAALERDDVAANAPAWCDGFFVVPKVLGGE